jgi:hypothetical protein
MYLKLGLWDELENISFFLYIKGPRTTIRNQKK